MDATDTEALHEDSPPHPAAAPADALWFRDAVIYQLHVKAYLDSNADGIGERLDVDLVEDGVLVPGHGRYRRSAKIWAGSLAGSRST